MAPEYRDDETRNEGGAPREAERPDDRKDPIGPVRSEIAARVSRLALEDLKGFAKVGFLDVEKFVRLKGQRLLVEKKLPFSLVVLAQERLKKEHDRWPVIVASRVDLPVEVQEASSEDLVSTSVVGFVDVEKVIRIDEEDILIEKKLPFHILILRQRDDRKKDGHRRDDERDVRDEPRRPYAGDR